jgi:Flp pilus assembly protein TadG
MRRRAERGTSAVELALLLPIFLTMILGTIDLGQAVVFYNITAEAAREGARVGMVLVTANLTTAPAMTAAQSTAIVTAARDKAGPFGTVLIVTPTTGIDAKGPYVRVQVSSTYQPVVGKLLGIGNITSGSTSSLYLP